MKITTALENINLIYHAESIKQDTVPAKEIAEPTELVAGWEAIYSSDSRVGKFWTAVWTIGGFFSKEFSLDEQLKHRIQESLHELDHFRAHNDPSGKSYRELKLTNELLKSADDIDINELSTKKEGRYFKFAKIALGDVQDAIDHLQSIKAVAEKNVGKLAAQEEIFRKTVGPKAYSIWENKAFPHLNHKAGFAQALPKDLSYKVDHPYNSLNWIDPSYAEISNGAIAAIKSLSSLIEFAYAIDPSLSTEELKKNLTAMLAINSSDEGYKRSVAIITNVFDFIQARRSLLHSQTIPAAFALNQLTKANDNLIALDPRFPVHKIISYMDSFFGFSIPEKAGDKPLLDPKSTELNYDFWQWYHRFPNPTITPSLDLNWCRKLSALLEPSAYLDKLVAQGLLHKRNIHDPMTIKCLFLLHQPNDKKCTLEDFSFTEEDNTLMTKLAEGKALSIADSEPLPLYMTYLKELKDEGHHSFKELVPFDLIFVKIALKVLKPHTKEEVKDICEAFLSDEPPEEKVQEYLVQMLAMKLKAKLDKGLTKTGFNNFMATEVSRGDLLITAFNNIMPFPRSIRWHDINI